MLSHPLFLWKKPRRQYKELKYPSKIDTQFSRVISVIIKLMDNPFTHHHVKKIMRQQLKALSEIVAQANDLFYEKNKTHDTVIGIMDKSLRKQGMNADAISVDCIPLNKKIVFLLHDEKPKLVDIAFGNKEGDISTSSQLQLDTLSVNCVVEFMNDYFK